RAADNVLPVGEARGSGQGQLQRNGAIFGPRVGHPAQRQNVAVRLGIGNAVQCLKDLFAGGSCGHRGRLFSAARAVQERAPPDPNHLRWRLRVRQATRDRGSPRVCPESLRCRKSGRNGPEEWLPHPTAKLPPEIRYRVTGSTIRAYCRNTQGKNQQWDREDEQRDKKPQAHVKPLRHGATSLKAYSQKAVTVNLRGRIVGRRAD